MRVRFRARSVFTVVQALCLLAAGSRPALGQTYRSWILAEGAANDFFDEEILIANPNGVVANVTITLLPEAGTPPAPQVIQVPATSRYTFRVNSVPNLPPGAVAARVESDVDVVVERSMYWAFGQRRGGHHSQGVLAPSNVWYLAEGVNGFFQTFVLITNTSTTAPAEGEVTFLLESGAPVTTPFTIPASGRKTIYVNQDFPHFASPYSTVVRQTNGATIVVERAMYWSDFEGGHGSAAVKEPSTTWLFAEGTTGTNALFDFQTYLLLANPGNTPASVTVDFFRDTGGLVSYPVDVPPTSRKTLSLDDLDFPNGVEELANASFSIRVTSSVPILAERAMYWSSAAGSLVDGHNAPGVTAEASKWAFAEGREGRFAESGTTSYDSYYLFSNAAAQPLRIKATFLREDGTGLVHTFTVGATSRATLLTGQFPELSNQRFSAFFEAVDESGTPITTQTFVAERATYWGPGYFGGHASTGTPWTSPLATPPVVDLTPTISSVVPAQGPLSGGTTVTVRGTNFTETTTIEFGGRPASSIDRVNATTLIATTPSGLAAGAVAVSVINAGKPPGTLANGFTYEAPPPTLPSVNILLAFGDSITIGTTSTTCDMGGTSMICYTETTAYPQRLRNLLAAEFPQAAVQVQNAGRGGECVDALCTSQRGKDRLPTTFTAAQDLVVILEGVNDINAGSSIASIRNALRLMVQTAKGAGKQVILCSLTPVRRRPDGTFLGHPDLDDRVAALNDGIAGVASDEQVGTVDMVAAFGGNTSLISVDGLHPTSSGYQRMAEAIRDLIRQHFLVAQ
jgi:lysophospholipase L1-like esterase